MALGPFNPSQAAGSSSFREQTLYSPLLNIYRAAKTASISEEEKEQFNALPEFFRMKITYQIASFGNKDSASEKKEESLKAEVFDDLPLLQRAIQAVALDEIESFEMTDTIYQK